MKEIGLCGNYYGGLNIKEENGKYYWSIENYSGMEWSEIPKYLYDALLKYNGNFIKLENQKQN
jgi:hypothetical protein